MQNRKIKPNSLQRILVITLSNLGDVILTTPVLSVLHLHFPNAQITVLVDAKSEEILKPCPWIVRVIAYDKKESRLKQLVRFLKMRSEHFDLVVDLRHTLIPWLVGARYRTRAVRKRKAQSMREHHLDRLRELGLEVPASLPGFEFFTPTDLQIARERLYKAGLKPSEAFVAIAPGARHFLKCWDAARFGGVARKIEEQFQKRIVILGAQNESEAALQLQRVCPTAINLCGELSISQSAVVISMAELMLSNDSALMHLAHALGIPCVSLFGPSNAVKYGLQNEISRVIQRSLPCVPCEKAQCQIQEKQKCLTDISEEEVFRAAHQLLQSLKKVS